MGSAGIAIGPDGKPIKKQDKQMSRGHRGGKKVREQRGAAGMPIGGRPFRPGGMGVGGPMRGPRMMVGHGNSAIMRVPGPVGPGMGIAPLMSALRGSPNGPGNGPRGVNDNFGFFRDVNPQRPVGLMSEDRTCPMHSGSTPSATSVGRGSIGNGSFGSGTSQTGQVQANSSSAPNMGNEVPGFGTNSSIHELFGKMVWRKMEGLRDEAVIDRLQNRIMNLIHDALADQNNATVGNGASGPAPTNGMSVNRDASHQSPLNFRSF